MRRAVQHLSQGDLHKWILNGLNHHILATSHPLRALSLLWKMRNVRLNIYKWSPCWSDRWLWACEQTWQIPDVMPQSFFGNLCSIRVKSTLIYWPNSVPADELGWIHNEIFLPRWRNPYSYESRQCRIHPHDLVLDVGACEGFFTLYAALHRQADVIAFEPVTNFIPSLQATVDHHRLNNRVRILGCGLSHTDHDGWFENSDSPFEGRVSQNTTGSAIKLRALDSLVAEGLVPRADFIKMDVEGHEESVLRGAAKLIRRFQPRLALAVYHTPTQGEEVKKAILEIDPTYHFKFSGMWLRDLKAAPRPATLYAWPCSRPRNIHP